MPRSAIDAGVVDHVLTAEEMPAKLLEFTSGVGRAPVSGEQLAASLSGICEILHRVTGHEFSGYKKGTLWRRISSRIQLLHLSSVDEYIERLTTDPHEPAIMVNALLIGVTQFFRDPDAFEFLGKHVIPRIIAGKKVGEAIRIWIPG